MAPPTVEDLANTNCPVASPYICAPTGHCCSALQFCQKGGECESCFPLNIATDQIHSWCNTVGYYNTSEMRHPSCKLACVAQFGYPPVPENNVCLLLYIPLGLLIVVLVSLVIAFLCYKKRCCRLLNTAVTKVKSKKNVYHVVVNNDKSEDQLIAQNKNTNESVTTDKPQNTIVEMEETKYETQTHEINTDVKQHHPKSDPGVKEDSVVPKSRLILGDINSATEPVETERHQHYSDSSPRSESGSRRQTPEGSVERGFPNEDDETSSNSSSLGQSSKGTIVISTTLPDQTSRMVTSHTPYLGTDCGV